jgi:hypothetical protein
MGLNSPWAILRCKWKDIDDEPLSDEYVEKMFTTAGAGTLNMVDFFDKMSHGYLDLSGSRVFGWFTLPRPNADSPAYNTPEFKPTHPNAMTQDELVNLALSTAANYSDEAKRVKNLDDFPHVVVLMNTHQHSILFGQQFGRAAVCDGSNCEPSYLGQEMGHPYGLEHSRRAGSLADYQDSWDIMSTLTASSSTVPGPHVPVGALAPYGTYGPGLNAANMRGRGWLDRSRVLTLDSGKGGFPATVQLRPLHARELPGYLALEIDDYIIEFRDNRKWDLGIYASAVFVHSFSDNHSYIEQNKNGAEELFVRDSWELGAEDITDLPYTRVLVKDIDAPNRIATLTLTRRPGRKFSVPVGGSMVPPWVDGGGFLGGSARQSVVVQPGDDLVDVVDHLVAFKSVESLRHGPARDAAQRAAMEQLAQYAEAQLGRLNAAETNRTPAPLSPDRKLERPSQLLFRGPELAARRSTPTR